ncbi:GDSL-type esterase/lipase family protein [Nocardioides pacificus]
MSRLPALPAPRRTLVLVGLLLAAVVAGGTATGVMTPARSAGQDAEPLRVMLVGDSLTHGHTGSASYRYWLWREFERQDVPVTFVGPDDDLAGGADWYEHSDHGFEKRHAAQAGSKFPFHLAVVERLVATHEPDVVVMLLGFNGANQGTPSLIADQTEDYLARTWAVDPEVRFVVGEIPGSDSRSRSAAANATTLTGNALVAERLADEPRVAIARLRTAPYRSWDPAQHTYDGTHPNATGETLMAQHFGDALAALGVLRQPVLAYHREQWEPQVRPRLRIDGRSLVVRWPSDAERAGLSSAQVRVRRLDGPLRVRSRWLVRTHYRVLLPRGRYAVELVPRRDRMTGVPTRPVVVRVGAGVGGPR